MCCTLSAQVAAQRRGRDQALEPIEAIYLHAVPDVGNAVSASDRFVGCGNVPVTTLISEPQHEIGPS